MRCFFEKSFILCYSKNTSKRINSFLCCQNKNMPGLCLFRDIQFPEQEYCSVVYLYFVEYKCIVYLLLKLIAIYHLENTYHKKINFVIHSFL